MNSLRVAPHQGKLVWKWMRETPRQESTNTDVQLILEESPDAQEVGVVRKVAGHANTVRAGSARSRSRLHRTGC